MLCARREVRVYTFFKYTGFVVPSQDGKVLEAIWMLV